MENLKLQHINRFQNTVATDRKGEFLCTLYRTDIVLFNHETRILYLDTGGHSTQTTTRRMNECFKYLGLQIVAGIEAGMPYLQAGYNGKTFAFDTESNDLLIEMTAVGSNFERIPDAWDEVAEAV